MANFPMDARRRLFLPLEICEGLGLPKGQPVVLTATIKDGILMVEPVATALVRVQTLVREKAGQGPLAGEVESVDPSQAIQAACVVDASAVLALLRGEPGHGLLTEAVAAGRSIHISAVSLVAIEEALIDLGFDEDEVEQILAPLGLEIAGYSVAETKAARAFAGRDLDVSTRAALALAAAKQVPLVSAQLDGDVGGVVVLRLGEGRGLAAEAVVEAVEAGPAVAVAPEKVVAETPVTHEVDALAGGHDFEAELQKAQVVLAKGEA